MAPAASNTGINLYARHLAIKLHPPCVYLEYEERKAGEQPKPRVRTVHLPSLQGHEVVDELASKVLLNFPRHLDRTTVNCKQLHHLIAQLVAHAGQHKAAHHSQQGQPQDAESLQRASEVGTTKTGSATNIATKSPQCHGVRKQEQLALDEVPVIVSVLRRITQSPAGAALAQQLQSKSDAGPMQRCIQLLDWAYRVYAHIPRSQLKSTPAGTAPPAELDASITAGLLSMKKQLTAEGDQEPGFIKAYRPDGLPDHTHSTPSSREQGTGSSSKNGSGLVPNAQPPRDVNQQGVPSTTENSMQHQQSSTNAAARPQPHASPSTTLPLHTALEAKHNGVTHAWAAETASSTASGSESAQHATTSNSSTGSSSLPAAQRWAAPATRAAVSDENEDDCLTLEVEVNGSANLNKVSDYELKLAKQAMDKDFQKTLLRPGDIGFEYDRQVDFGPAVEPNDWDDGASESEDSVF